MTAKTYLTVAFITFLAISLPFVAIHLIANPDDAQLTTLQHLVAVVANFFGPWGVAIVRLVDYPNAGLRSFSWPWALGLSILASLLLVLPLRIRHRPLQLSFAVLWGLFCLAWFVVGLGQIASGLL